MDPNERPSASVRPAGFAGSGSDALRSVVLLRGEHDVATRERVSDAIARASRLDDADLVVDLSSVTFMDASTIGAIVDAHNRLRARSRSLCVRAPTARARRLLDVCELGFLIEEPAGTRDEGTALRSWVAVPASDPVPDSAAPLVPPPGRPTRAPAEERSGPDGSVLRSRSPS